MKNVNYDEIILAHSTDSSTFFGSFPMELQDHIVMQMKAFHKIEYVRTSGGGAFFGFSRSLEIWVPKHYNWLLFAVNHKQI